MDWGNEFLAKLREMIINDYDITVKPIISMNPQTSIMLERAHQMIGKSLRTFKVQNMALDDENLWSGILAFAIVALIAVHTTSHSIPSCLISLGTRFNNKSTS